MKCLSSEGRWCPELFISSGCPFPALLPDCDRCSHSPVPLQDSLFWTAFEFYRLDALILAFIHTESKASRHDIATLHSSPPFMHHWSLSLHPRAAKTTINSLHVLSSSKSDSLVQVQGSEREYVEVDILSMHNANIDLEIHLGSPFPSSFCPRPAHFVFCLRPIQVILPRS